MPPNMDATIVMVSVDTSSEDSSRGTKSREVGVVEVVERVPMPLPARIPALKPEVSAPSAITNVDDATAKSHVIVGTMGP